MSVVPAYNPAIAITNLLACLTLSTSFAYVYLGLMHQSWDTCGRAQCVTISSWGNIDTPCYIYVYIDMCVT